MTILVSDTSVLIDLERGSLLEPVFGLSATFGVPDLLYERELKDHGGPGLLALGLKVLELNDDEVILSQHYRSLARHISLPDSFALALATRSDHKLLTGDKALRILAESRGVPCHGVLWVVDQLIEAKTVHKVILAAKLEQIVGHPGCRLPRREVKLRVDRLLGRN